MAIITLTSDLGSNSHYPAIIKGVILNLLPTAKLIDVTHDIASFDIMEAAFVVKNMFKAYPDGTFHIIAVDPDGHEENPGVVVMHAGHVFIGPDNGIVKLICETEYCEGYLIHNTDLFHQSYPPSFRAASIFGPVAAFLASGGNIDEVGIPTQVKDLRWGYPSFSDGCLRGKIIHIDKFGNAITNIRRSEFMQIKNGRRFEIYIRNVRLRRIVNTYADVSKADALAIFGGDDHLEIAMREASAAELLGLKINDMITIEFSK